MAALVNASRPVSIALSCSFCVLYRCTQTARRKVALPVFDPDATPVKPSATPAAAAC
jgi:hypothetical protein